MTVTCVIQARTGSTRLPGKVLADVCGSPMLGFMLNRIRDADVDDIVVATSDAAGDDAVAEVAIAAGIRVVRGSEHDVLDRFRLVLEEHPADAIVRLTADCPLSDPDLIGRVLALHAATGAHYTSNTLVRTYPDGLDVEVISASALLAAAAEARDPAEREHVTPFVYRRPERFRLAAQRASRLLGGERWTVDTPDDLQFVRDVCARLGDPRAGWHEILATVGVQQREPSGGGSFRIATASDAETTGPWVLHHLHDPSVRTWVVEATGQVAGWLRVATRAGVGTLLVDLPDPLLPFALTKLLAALREDYQVRELRWATTRGLTDALQAAGFSFHGEAGTTLSWVR